MQSIGEMFEHIKISKLFKTLCAASLYILFSFLIIPWLSFPLNATDLPVKFENLTSQDGLSQNSVYTILQDQDGFMWFGTRIGLNRYDGKTFKIFLPDLYDQGSIPSNRISSLCEDQEGSLWVGTMDAGLAKYNKSEENFIRFQHDPSDSTSLPSNYIETLFLDSNGVLWIGTKNGLCKYDPASNSFNKIQLFKDASISETTRHIMALAEFPVGTMWVGTENSSLLRFSTTDFKVEIIKETVKNSSTYVSCLQADTSRNCLWVGVFGWTLLKFDPETGLDRALNWEQSKTEGMIAAIDNLTLDKVGNLWIGSVQAVTRYNPDAEIFHIFRANRNKIDALQDDIIQASYLDPQGNVWIGTHAGGVSKYSPGLIRFEHIKANPGSTTSLLSDGIFSIAEGENGQIWFGTIGGGTSVLDPITRDYSSFTSDDSEVDWSWNYISKILPISESSIWLGTFRCGFFHLNPKTGKLTLYANEDIVPTSFSDHTVYALLKDSEGTIWIGTETQGLDRFNKETSSFTHFKHIPEDSSSIGSNQIYALLEDHMGYIWIGTGGYGLSRMDNRDNSFTHIGVKQKGEMGLSGNNVLCLYEDPDNNLWVGTRGAGLNRINPQRNEITQLKLGTKTQALTVYSILQDDQQYLWLSTSNGIMKVHPDSGLVRLYTRSDGVLEEFYRSSSLNASDGFMYFGGIDGYNRFHPDSIRDNPHVPPIVLTGLSINYQNVKIGEPVGGRTILENSISQTDELRLSYKDRVLHFNFAALDFSASYRNQYAHKLEGYDENWIHSGTENYAQYMNLPAGEYIFRVRGSNNDGVWNMEGSSIKVSISPPFWKTVWFKLLLTVSLLGCILLYIQLRTAKLKSQQMKLEALVRERTSQLKGEIEERQRIESEKLELKMDHLKRELLTQTLHLNDKQQIMDNLQEEMEEVCDLKPDQAKPKLQKLLRFLKDRSSVKQGWEDFELWFTEVHTGFYSELREAYPTLSESELKVCALLRLKMISKDIAKVMNVQPTSIDIYRHRIRKKIDLSGDENLSTFMSQF